MPPEVRINGEVGIDDIATGAADAPHVGALGAERIDAARVWAATRDSPEHADLVAASVSACRPPGARGIQECLSERRHGRLKIDNNGAEQALRPIVLGRKNYLFAGSEAAAHRTAILRSVVQMCKHLQINPFVYLCDVIERVSTHPARLVLELTPREWKWLRQDAIAQAAA
jgi:hypothetical protein